MFGYEVLSGESGFLILMAFMTVLLTSVSFIADKFKMFNSEAK